MIVRDRIGGGVEVRAPAKLNLFLEILGKRPDGYHDLDSLMVAISLDDVLECEDDPSGQISLSCNEPSLPTDGSNLVVKAAQKMRAESKADRGAKIRLHKEIPWQAGLAGGSSDAAATLLALDRLWNLKTRPERLEALAGEIGSDVAFFLHEPAARCTGRGEKVEPLTLSGTWHFVLVCPPIGVSTAEVYKHLKVPEQPRSIDAALQALKSQNTRALGLSLFNRLQPVAESIEPRLVAVRQALESLQPSLDGHLMSGSGSAYFGLCRDERAAGHAAHQLESLGLGRVRAVTCGP